MKKLLLATGLSAALLMPSLSQAATYEIDTQGAHAFIQFKIQHLGYSCWAASIPLKASLNGMPRHRRNRPFR